MSEQSRPGWWQASDGRWYPPESHPDYRASAPPPPPARGQRQRKPKSGTPVWKLALGVCLGLFLFLGVCAALVGQGAKDLGDEIDRATAPKPAVVRVEAGTDVCWSGSIGGATREGCGSESFDVETTAGDLLSVVVQKQVEGGGELAVAIDIDGAERARNSTTAGFGVVSVSTS